MIDYKLIAIDYEVTPEDDDRLLDIKTKIQKSLTEPERRILYTYLELGTYSATAKEYGVSSPTIKKYVKKIIEKLR